MHSRQGYSYFDLKFCFVDKNCKLLIKLKNQPHLVLGSSDECITVRDIIESVHKISQPKVFDDFYSYYRRSIYKTKCDFKYAQLLVKSYCECLKLKVEPRIKWLNNEEGSRNTIEKEERSNKKLSCEKMIVRERSNLKRVNFPNRIHTESKQLLKEYVPRS